MLLQWLECIEWKDKEEALIESRLDLVSNGEFLTPFEDMTHSIMDEAIDETNLIDNNPREILDIYKSHPWRLKMMETSISKEATS
jgi:hypothetical protein